MQITRIKKLFIIIWGILFLSNMPVISLAQIPQTINYQGYLTDSGGTPENGSVSMTFSIYDVDIGGTALWSQTQTVQVNQGVYNVILGGGTVPNPINLPFDRQYYLGVKVGTDNEMDPRQTLTSVPYALNKFLLACVTAGVRDPTATSVDVMILNQKNINVSDWSDVFNPFYIQPHPYAPTEIIWGLQCKDDWVNTGCAQGSRDGYNAGPDRDIAQFNNGCFSDDEEVQKLVVFTTCCKIVQ